MIHNEDQSPASTNESKNSLKSAETSEVVIKFITVIVYLMSVSMAAIALSLYYLFFWNPTVQSGPETLVHPIQLHLSQFYFNVTQKDVRVKMSKKSVSRGSTNGAVGSEIKFAGNDKEKMYESKHRRKLVRVLTVIAYLFSVSLAAIMLSLFYVFIYSPGKPAGENSRDHEFPQLPSQRDKMRQETLDILNDTYLNSEREEPRALPIKGSKDSFWRHSGLAEDTELYFNSSAESEKQNKTVFKKIMKLFKTE